MTLLDIRKRTAEKMADEDRLPCMSCRTPTLLVTLTEYGARCFRCYETYCSTRTLAPKRRLDPRDDPRNWARNLKARHDEGEILSPMQVDAYKAALRSE